MRSFKMTRHCQPTSYQDMERSADLQTMHNMALFRGHSVHAKFGGALIFGSSSLLLSQNARFVYGMGKCWMLKVPGAPRLCAEKWDKHPWSSSLVLYVFSWPCSAMAWSFILTPPKKVCYHSAPFCAREACKMKERSNQRNHVLSWLYCCCMLLHVVGVGGLVCLYAFMILNKSIIVYDLALQGRTWGTGT